jgi:Pvc16 N-terminal domain
VEKVKRLNGSEARLTRLNSRQMMRVYLRPHPWGMSAIMIDDLDRTLKNLLEDPECGLPELDPSPTITFGAPDSKFAPTPPAINLFLYDVRENRELRSNEVVVERTADGKASLLPSPPRVDCSYLITAWAADGAPDAEHRLLGAVMRVLLCSATIPERVLHGELKDQQVALPVATLQSSRLQSVGEFWQAGGRPKAVLHFTVTISVPIGKAQSEHLVTERIVRMRVGTQEGR